MSQELTHAELAKWLRNVVAKRYVHERTGEQPKAAWDRFHRIASLLATETPGIASYCGDRLVAIQCDQRDGDKERSMLAVEVLVTVRKVQTGGVSQ